MQKFSGEDFSAFVSAWVRRAQAAKANCKTSEVASWEAVDQLTKTTWLLGTIQVTLIILFATVGGAEILDPSVAPGTGSQGYNMFIGVEIMMFVGFGYLMTFLKWYGLGAVGLTMMVTAVGLQWSLFTESFFGQLMNNANDWHYVEINIYSLLNTLYAMSAVLISFGALIGKISPLQLLTMTVIELALHSVNYRVLMEGVLGVVDMGGTYMDHMFGAYFGLAVSMMLGKPSSEPEMGNTPDVFSLIGTLFLWVYWPSFVAGAADADSLQQQRAIVNTILSLAASTVAAFWMSSLLSKNGRFRPVDVQNATLAGGVAIGCVANLTLSAFGAVMIGITAGIVSTFGYNVLQPMLEERIGLHDTCGIHNLHAMPSVIGGISSVILAGYKGTLGKSHDVVIYGNLVHVQWWHQLVGIVLCVGFAVSTGLFTGFVLTLLAPCKNDPTKGKVKEFHDCEYWEVGADYGESLYTELALLAGDEKIKSDIMSILPDWSSHNGRRGTAGRLDWSSHNGRRSEGRRLASSEEWGQQVVKELEKTSSREMDITIDKTVDLNTIIV